MEISWNFVSPEKWEPCLNITMKLGPRNILKQYSPVIFHREKVSVNLCLTV